MWRSCIAQIHTSHFNRKSPVLAQSPRRVIQIGCSSCLRGGSSLQTGIGRLNFFPLRTREKIKFQNVLNLRLNSSPHAPSASFKLEICLLLPPLFWHSLHPPFRIVSFQEELPVGSIPCPPFCSLVLYSSRPVHLLCLCILCLNPVFKLP